MVKRTFLSVNGLSEESADVANERACAAKAHSNGKPANKAPHHLSQPKMKIIQGVNRKANDPAIKMFLGERNPVRVMVRSLVFLDLFL